MNLSEASALLWTERAIALALLLQTIELLQIRGACADDGLWSRKILAREQHALPLPLRILLAPLTCFLPYRAWLGLLLARLIGSGLWLASGWLGWAPVLLFTQVAVCVRFRGTFNGGSDYMSVLILVALSAAALEPGLGRAALLYIAVQTTLSYATAGLLKLRQHAWRSGRALQTFLLASQYGAPDWVRDTLATPRRSRLLASAVIAFETALPLAWLDARLCGLLIVSGLGFHAANALVFGLNRFLFAWAAAYPALWYGSQLLRSIS